MNRIHLNEDEYRSKVYGGWMSKNIGHSWRPGRGVKNLWSWTFTLYFPMVNAQ